MLLLLLCGLFLGTANAFAAAPDLTVTSVSGPVSANRSQQIQVTVKVKNIGTSKISKSTTVNIYLSTDNTITTGDAYIGSVTAGALAVGAESTFTPLATIPSNMAFGTYYIGAIADAKNVIAESNETNNSLAGNQIYISTDTTPPTGTVMINGGAAATNNPAVTLMLSASDTESGVSQMQFSNDNSAWSTVEAYATAKSWTLSGGDGPKTVYVKFKDVAGNWSTAVSSSISLDTTPPTTSVSPPGGLYNAPQSVTLTANEAATINYTTDGSSPKPGSPVYTAPLSIEATTTLKYFAIDLSGNNEKVVQTATYTIDTIPPVLSLSALPSGSVTNNVTLNVAGTVTDNIAVQSVTINGTAVTLSANGGFNQAITLVSGPNIITTIAKDTANNTTTDSRTITLDQTSTWVTINSVTTPTNRSSQAISGTREAGLIVSVACPTATVGTVSYPTANTWQAAITNMTEGSNLISATASDQAGNRSTTTSVMIILDTVPPVTTATPAGGTYASGQSVTLAANEPATIYYTANGTMPTDTSNIYTGPINVHATTTIMFFAKDLAGNSENVRTNTYAIMQPASSVRLTADRPSHIALGDTITFTAQASGGSGAYDYQFSSNGDNSTAPFYSPSNTWTWTSTRAQDVTVEVMARNQGSTAGYEARTSVSLRVADSSLNANGGAYYLPDTGQKTCYKDKGTGSELGVCPTPGQPLAQDGSYSMFPPSFTINGDGTVTDNNTFLIWQQGNSSDCANLTLAGHSDWRPPSNLELLSIVDYGAYNPAVDGSIFPLTGSAPYWTSTQNDGGAWAVNFNDGSVNTLNGSAYGKCVRGAMKSGDLQLNSDNTMSDITTGLMWHSNGNTAVTWGQALTVCEGSGFAGYSDWRIPNIKELESLVDANTTHSFVGSYPYWSSTTAVGDTSKAWTASFPYGAIVGTTKGSNNTTYAMCVRGEKSPFLDEQAISIDPTTVSFDNVDIQSTGTRTITITNIGGATLTVDTPVSPAAPFSIRTDGCSGQSLHSWDSCALVVSFSPESSGSYPSAITITSNDADRPSITIHLSGIGVDRGRVYALPDTGQTSCFDAVDTNITCPSQGSALAQDGSYLLSPPSLAAGSNGTVSDNNTGLMWQRTDDGTLRTWYEAADYCEQLVLGGYEDWRLPVKHELFSIADLGRYAPSINTSVFQNTKTSYWSFSTDQADPDSAWSVFFGQNVDGGTCYVNGWYNWNNYTGVSVGSSDKNSTKKYTRCVRGETLSFGVVSDNSNSTLTDTATGLVWQQGNGYTSTWTDALAYCEGLELGGDDDWRLPNVKELETISIENAVTSFVNTSGYYWSSTSLGVIDCGLLWADTLAYVVSLPDGRVNGQASKSSSNSVRCVRGGTTAQPATIEGTITNAATGLPLANVTVTINDSASHSFSAISDTAGKYSVSGMSPGAYSASYQQTAYITYSTSGTLSSGQRLTLNAQLSSVPSLVVAISSPQNRAVLHTSTVPVSGTVTAGASVTVNGITATVSNGTYSATISLGDGQRTITATASDQYSQTATSSVTVTVLTKGTVTGSVTDPATGVGVPGATVIVIDSVPNSQTATADTNGIYSLPNVAQGAFGVSMTATDYSTYMTTANMAPGQTITVNGAIALQAPVISAIAVPSVTIDSATLTWATDQATSTLIEYGLTTSYGSMTADAALTTSHSIPLPGLLQGTTYHYRIVSTNSHGLSATSGDHIFTTPAPPVITGVTVASAGTDTATVTWTTDQPTDSMVSYGTTTAYGSSATNATMTTNHSITLTGLSLQTKYHFIVRSTNATGFSGTSGDNSFTTAGPIVVTITSPTDGSTISRPYVLMKGTVINTTGNETGVTVNGMLASVYGNEFVVNHVPLAEGVNTITVNATDSAGYTASASIAIIAGAVGSSITLVANVDSGIAPLETMLRVEGYATGTTPSLSVLGPGAVDWTNCTSYDVCRVKLTTEGVYYFTASGIGSDGNPHQDTIAVTVLSRTALDALLQAKWSGMKTKLASQNIEGAVGLFISASQDRYREVFTALTPILAEMVMNMQDVQLVSLSDGMAKYRIGKNEIYGGQEMLITYNIYFTKDDKGLWMIEKF